MFIKLYYICKDINEFKQQHKVYVELRIDYDSVNPPKAEAETKPKIKPAKSEIRSYNCSVNNYKSVSCKNKDTSLFCF